jgi:hypothetical protein
MSSSTEWAADGGGPAAPPSRVPADSPSAAAEPPDQEPAVSDPDSRADRAPHDVPWFLPEGRAGLAPESLTIDAAATSADTAVDLQAVVDIAGAPPWAAEPAAAEPEAPPPWESGPWPSRSPGSGADTRSGRGRPEPDASDQDGSGDSLPPARRVESRPAQPGDWSAVDRRLAGDPSTRVSIRPAGGRSTAGPAEPAANGYATAALILGIAGILVVPGIAAGILGLRRAKVTGTGQAQSWLGIGLSLLWAVGIIVVVSLPGTSVSADAGCGAYRASGRAAVARVTSALGSSAPAAQLRTDLSAAASAVNSAAAQAQDVDVRSALSGLTEDLQAGVRLAGLRPAARTTLQTTLTGDAASVAKFCG